MKIEKDYYFEDEDSEVCYEIEHFTRYMQEGQEKVLLKAKKLRSSDFAWCKAYSELLEKGDSVCGKSCKHYEPRNGKSGCCKSYTDVLYEASETVVVKIENNEVIIKNMNNMIVVNKNYIRISNREEYEKLLKSGFFWEFYPELAGDWEQDKKLIFSC